MEGRRTQMQFVKKDYFNNKKNKLRVTRHGEEKRGVAKEIKNTGQDQEQA